MYENPLHHLDVTLDADDDADDRTVQWLKRDLERRRAQRAERTEAELVSSP